MSDRSEALGAAYPGDLSLLLIPVKGKAPIGAGWNAKALQRLSDGDRDSHLGRIVNHLAGGGNVGLVIPLPWLCLDVDDPASAAVVEARCPGAPKQATSKGAHFFFLAPPGEVRGTVKVELEPGVFADLRAGGRNQVVVEPSVHPSGFRYRWERSLAEYDPEPLPAEWVGPVTAQVAAPASASASAAKGKVGEGGRDAHLFGYASRLRARGLTEEEIVERVLEENLRTCDPPLPESQARAKARSASKYAPGVSDGEAERWPKDCASYAEAVATMNEYAALLVGEGAPQVVFRRAGSQHYTSPVGASAFFLAAPTVRYENEDEKMKCVERSWYRDGEARTVDVALRARSLPNGFSERLGIKYVNTYVPPPSYPAPSVEDIHTYVYPFTKELLVMQFGEKDARTFCAAVALHWQGMHDPLLARPFWALVVAGQGGDGKGLVGRLLREIYEWRPRYTGSLNTPSAKDAPRFFESGCDGKMFVRIEEVKTKGVFEVLKAQMDEMSSKERKGKDAFDSHNDALLYITTNEPRCIPLDQETHVRRWAAFEFRESLKNHPALVDKLNALLGQTRCIEVWRAYLQHLRWQGIVDHRWAPETSSREMLREEGKGEPDAVIDRVLTDPPAGADSLANLPWVFSAKEFLSAIRAAPESLRDVFDFKTTAAWASDQLKRRRGTLVERVSEDKIMVDTVRERWWARGPDRKDCIAPKMESSRKTAARIRKYRA